MVSSGFAITIATFRTSPASSTSSSSRSAVMAAPRSRSGDTFPVEKSETMTTGGKMAPVADVTLPEADEPVLLRIGFTDDQGWAALRDEVEAGAAEYGVDFEFVTYVDDPAFRDLPVERVALAGHPHPVLVLADDVTFASAEHPLLVVDVDEEPSTAFRATPDAIYSIVINLGLGNMDFTDFSEDVDSSGIYRRSREERETIAALVALDEAD